MLLFGSMNWTFTWLKPEGPLTHTTLAPVVADLFFGGLGAVQKLPLQKRRARPLRG
jgi:Tetracyclin repressor-like, C-terminal domain